MHNLSICIIVLNYNDKETTSNFIKNHININIIDKIIVVDNCSTDNSFGYLLSYSSPKIDVIKSNYNGGYSYGNNFGVDFALLNYKPKFIVISNPDVVFDEKTLFKMRQKLISNPSIAQISPTMTGKNIRIQNIAWKLPNFIDILKEIILPRSKKDSLIYFKKSLKDNDGIFVDVLSGALFMIRSELFLEFGLFDISTFLYCEENILAFKIKKKGYRNFLLNNYYYFHEQEKSINRSIKSYKSKSKILFNSLTIYNVNYLLINKIQLLIFTFLWIFMFYFKLLIKTILRINSA